MSEENKIQESEQQLTPEQLEARAKARAKMKKWLIWVITICMFYNVLFFTCQYRKEAKKDAVQEYFQKKFQADTAHRNKLLRQGIDRSKRTKIDTVAK